MIKLFKGTENNIHTISRDLTRAYFEYLKSLEGTYLYTVLDSNYDMCISLYRHSLCTMLGLSSTLEYRELECLVDSCVSALEEVYNYNESTLRKEAVIQACSHCICLARKRAEGGF